MKSRFRNLSIKEKIALSMNGVILLLLLLVYAISIIFFSVFIRNDTYASYNNLIDNIGLRLDYHYQSIINYIISLHTNTEFTSLASDFENKFIPQYQKQIEVQPFISGLIGSSALIEQAIIADRNGAVYSNFTLDMRHTENVAELRDSGSIRLIPYEDYSFVVNKSEVMPLVIPIYEIDDRVFSFSGNSTQYRYSFIQFIPYTALSKLLRNDLKDNLIDFRVINNTGNTVIENSDGFNSKGNYLFSLPFFNGIGDLQILLSSQRIHKRIMTLSLLMILQSIIVLAFAAFLIIRISGLLVRPIKILTKIVKRIENGTYLKPYTINSDDEIGLLCTAINQMHETIQTQIKHITVSEEEKYNLRMKLITEQIKPHFLYNTFEYINAEIESGHNGNASRMLMTLTEYLRLGLNNGEETSTISNEISHSDAYLKIMNSRFHSRIKMIHSIPEEYCNIRMPKMLLQPLIENSIKHGFRKTSILGMIETPEIIISLSRENQKYTLIIADNGAGIDIKKAEDAIKSNSISQHIGLQNIYQRLLMLYPDTAIRFTSIPFYKNEVIITFTA